MLAGDVVTDVVTDVAHGEGIVGALLDGAVFDESVGQVLSEDAFIHETFAHDAYAEGVYADDAQAGEQFAHDASWQDGDAQNTRTQELATADALSYEAAESALDASADTTAEATELPSYEALLAGGDELLPSIESFVDDTHDQPSALFQAVDEAEFGALAAVPPLDESESAGMFANAGEIESGHAHGDAAQSAHEHAGDAQAGAMYAGAAHEHDLLAHEPLGTDTALPHAVAATDADGHDAETDSAAHRTEAGMAGGPEDSWMLGETGKHLDALSQAFTSRDTTRPPVAAPLLDERAIHSPEAVAEREAHPMWGNEAWMDIMPSPGDSRFSVASPDVLHAAADAETAVPSEQTEAAARALELLAAHVRRGELPLPAGSADIGDAALLAGVLAAMLGYRR